MNAYDPTLFTQERFVLWLDRQPLYREFNYNDPQNCVLATFLRDDLGLDGISHFTPLLVGPKDFSYLKVNYVLPDWALSLSEAMGNFVFVPGGIYRPISISDVKQLLTTLVNQNKLELNET